MNPEVSVIIPVFNREELIKDTLKSLQKQTFQEWEALIIDDNSTDKTQMVVEQIILGDERFKLIKKNSDLPKGANTSRNIGVQRSAAGLLIFLDSDDILLPTCLESRVAYLRANPILDFAVFPQMTFENRVSERGLLININTEEDILDRFLRFGKDIDVPWLNTAPIWRKKFLIRNALEWQESLPCFQDLFFHISALSKNPNFSIADHSPDCKYRIHTGDRVGRLVHDPKIVKELVKHFIQLRQLLKQAGCLSGRRERMLLQSIYFSAILKQIDAEHFEQSNNAIEELKNAGMLSASIHKKLRAYIYLRKKIVTYPRLRFYVNRLFKKITQNSIYASNPSHYMAHDYETSLR